MTSRDLPIDTRPLAIFLMGPTASGKTALALYLAERFPLELISVDSTLVYRGMNIGTAKPDAETLARFPHRLIDIREPSQIYSAAEFRSDALREMRAITASGKTPLLVGGTGLYFESLQHGLSVLPEADAVVRERLSMEAAEQGWDALHARLNRLDPASGAKIRPNDTQRVQRALEVIELTGRPLSEQQLGRRQRFGYRVLKLALVPNDRSVLHERIAQRMDIMLRDGLIDEVRTLRANAGLSPNLPSMRAVGYRQTLQHLDSEFDASELRERAIFATRQLAKRQITWLRSELDARSIDPLDRRHPDIAALAASDFIGTS